MSDVPLRIRVKVFADIVRAVRDLEMEEIAHCNITPENILIVGDCEGSQGCSAVLCDLGRMSRVTDLEDNPDYLAMTRILWNLLTKGKPKPAESRATRGERRGKAEENMHRCLVEVWQAMATSHNGADFPTAEAVESLAAAGGVDLSPRAVTKLHGWSA